MPDVTATVSVPDQKVRLLQEALQTYRDQNGLDDTYTSQMWFDFLFQEALTGQWRMADTEEVANMALQYEGADDATRAQVDAILNPAP